MHGINVQVLRIVLAIRGTKFPQYIAFSIMMPDTALMPGISFSSGH